MTLDRVGVLAGGLLASALLVLGLVGPRALPEPPLPQSPVADVAPHTPPGDRTSDADRAAAACTAGQVEHAACRLPPGRLRRDDGASPRPAGPDAPAPPSRNRAD